MVEIHYQYRSPSEVGSCPTVPLIICHLPHSYLTNECNIILSIQCQETFAGPETVRAGERARVARQQEGMGVVEAVSISNGKTGCTRREQPTAILRRDNRRGKKSRREVH